MHAATEHGYRWMFEKQGGEWNEFGIENSIEIESTWRDGIWACTLQGDELTPGRTCNLVVMLDDMVTYAWGVAGPETKIRRVHHCPGSAQAEEDTKNALHGSNEQLPASA